MGHKETAQGGTSGWLAAAAAAFFAYYFWLHVVIGPLKADELYFAHVFWLIRQGLEPFRDFYESHVPFYFHLFLPILPGSSPDDLGFVGWLRAYGVVIALAFPLMLWRLERRHFLILLPVLLIFLIWGRMIEIRSDTVGLLLLNLGWWAMLRHPGRRGMLVAGVLAGAALFFSARAAPMALGIAAGCLVLCLRHRDMWTIALLAGEAALFVVILGLAYLADPAGFMQTIDAVYLTSSAVTPHLGLAARLFEPERLVLLLWIVAALAAASRRWRDDRAAIIAIACAAQLALVLLDPSPFLYVYGWSLIPVLAGLAFIAEHARGRLAIASLAAAPALAIVALALAAPQEPRAGSLARLTADRPLDRAALDRAPTARLMAMMVSTERQQWLPNQLRLLESLCRRIDAPVATLFYANMVCLPDTGHDWPGHLWPDLLEGRLAGGPRAPFVAMLDTHKPAVVAWGKQFYRPPLSAWGRTALRDYDVYEGFAIRRAPTPR